MVKKWRASHQYFKNKTEKFSAVVSLFCNMKEWNNASYHPHQKPKRKWKKERGGLRGEREWTCEDIQRNCIGGTIWFRSQTSYNTKWILVTSIYLFWSFSPFLCKLEKQKILAAEKVTVKTWIGYLIKFVKSISHWIQTNNAKSISNFYIFYFNFSRTLFRSQYNTASDLVTR